MWIFCVDILSSTEKFILAEGLVRSPVMIWRIFDPSLIHCSATIGTHPCHRYPGLIDFEHIAGIPFAPIMLENYQDGFGAGRGVLLPFDRATIRILNLPRKLREKVARMRTLFIANDGKTNRLWIHYFHYTLLTEIDVNLLKSKLLMQFEELQTGIILRIPHLVSLQNPYGLLQVRGGILVFATDLPEGNSQTSCKKQSGEFCLNTSASNRRVAYRHFPIKICSHSERSH